MLSWSSCLWMHMKSCSHSIDVLQISEPFSFISPPPKKTIWQIITELCYDSLQKGSLVLTFRRQERAWLCVWSGLFVADWIRWFVICQAWGVNVPCLQWRGTKNCWKGQSKVQLALECISTLCMSDFCPYFSVWDKNPPFLHIIVGETNGWDDTLSPQAPPILCMSFPSPLLMTSFHRCWCKAHCCKVCFYKPCSGFSTFFAIAIHLVTKL